MTEQDRPTEDGDDKQKHVAQGAAFLPIGLVFFVIGLTRVDEGSGSPFLIIGLAFLVMSFGWMARAQSGGGRRDAATPERRGHQGDGGGTSAGDGGSGGHGRGGGDGPGDHGHGGSDSGGGDGGGGGD
ncbi:hypothetical protein ACFUMH_03675 [Cellulomonas sp. NPDC057328]|uniref:hypothetical protein n=1 Tax=Cellulomonas sp. NPDC057328 TaxID=3346101 RepID=UPI003625E6DF